MKRFWALLICFILVISQLLAVSGCGKTENTDNNENNANNEESTDAQTQAEAVPVVNPSKDPRDYKTPKVLSDQFKITCASYVSMGETHFIDAFKSNEGDYALILPYSVGLENVALYFNVPKGAELTVNSQKVSRGFQFFDFSKDADISIKYVYDSKKISEKTRLTVYTTKTPIMYLDVNEKLGTIDAMHKDMDKNTHCYGVAYIDSLDNSKDVISHFDIHGHGNSTWTRLEKRPYNIKFTDNDEFDSSRKVSVLGMSAASKWCLLADVWDRTLARNRLAHYLGGQIDMDYAIETDYVHLYLGSEYKGSYLITEKAAGIEDAVGLELADGDNMNGSWIFEFDNHTNQPHQFKFDKLTVSVKSKIEGCQYNALKNHLKEINTALKDANGYNSKTGKYYYDYIDLESFAKYILIREFTMDYDTLVNYWAYYDARDGKVHAGPLWDFDNSMGNSGKSIYRQTDALLILEDNTKPRDCWFIKLMQFEKFRDILKEEYQKYSYLFDSEDERSAFAVYESWFEEIKPIAELNHLRWGFEGETLKLNGFEIENSRFGLEYAYVSKFLYDRSKAYGKRLMRL